MEELKQNTEVVAETNKELFTNSDLKALEFLNLKTQVNDIKHMVTKLDNENKKVLNDDELSDYLDERIKDMTESQIKGLTKEEIVEIYTLNGNEIVLDITTDDPKKDIEFKRDYLAFKKNSVEATEKFDAEIEKIEKEIADCKEEYETVIKEFGNPSEVIKNRLVESIKNAPTDKDKQKFVRYMNEFENAFTLNNVYDYAKSYKGASILECYHNNKKAMNMYKKYKKVVESLGLKQDLSKVSFLERYLTDVKYHKRPNMFLFTVMHMIASWSNKPVDYSKGLFLSQFGINIKDLVYNQFTDEEKKEEFINNIMKVLEVRF